MNAAVRIEPRDDANPGTTAVVLLNFYWYYPEPQLTVKLVGKNTVHWFLAGIGSRGDYSIITGNTITNADGAGVRVGGSVEDGVQYGVHNEVRGRKRAKPFRVERSA